MSCPSGSVPRPALAEMTNRINKRVFEGCAGNSSDGREDGAEELPVSKQVCLGMERECEGSLTEKGLSDCETDRVGKDAVVFWNLVSEVGGAVEDLNVAARVEGIESVYNVVELDAVSRDSCCSTPLIPLRSESCNRDSSGGEILPENVVRAAQSGSLHRTCLPGDCAGGDKDVNVAFLNLGQIESAKFLKPIGVHSFELERCTALKGDGNSSIASAADMLKTCTCSFCLKAAYIWSDLYYQDVKGRISAAKKSKKEAVNMFQRICLGREPNAHGQGSSDEPSKLETDLSSQWRSLFTHMEEGFALDTNHFQDQFLALKELRENCKVNLEMINAKPADHD